MGINWINLNKYGRRDRNTQISIGTSGQGYISARIVDAIGLAEGDSLRFCKARLNGDGEEEPQLYMTVIEKSDEDLGGAVVRSDSSSGARTCSLTSLMYALGVDHKEQKYALDVDLEPVFYDDTFFYPLQLTERE